MTCPPPNDECAGATVITTLPFTETVGVGLYTTNASDPDTSCEILIAGGPWPKDGGWWYQWTALAGVTSLTVHTCDPANSNNDTVIGLFTGACGSLVEADCGEDECIEAGVCNGDVGFGASTFTFTPVVPGTTYRILIDHYSGGVCDNSTTVTITSP